MRWRIEKFIFCDQQQTLTSGDKAHQLEPMAVELLAYFCKNRDRIISRDQLIDEVWHGRLITDNAVSKVVTKLRKLLGDNAKKPQFIATFPKKGYKFIACVSEVVDLESVDEDGKTDESPSNVLNVRTSVVPPQKKRFGWLLPISAIVILVLLIRAFLAEESTPSMGVKALTRAAGMEWQPRVSPDGKYLSYIEVRDKKIRLWIGDLSDGQSVEVNHGDENEIVVGPGKWNRDGSKFVYLVATSSTCQYFIRTIYGLTLGKPKLIHNCPAGSRGKIEFSHDDDKLIYAESAGGQAPYSLYEMTLSTGKKRRINQPELILGGNISFDLHPFENKLLISSPDEQLWEGFYSLDLDNDELSLLFKQDAFICCGIWDHTGQRIVLLGEHPAVQLVSYDLDGRDRKVVYSGSQRLSPPERHSNGNDYVFPAGRGNLDAYYYAFSTQTTKTIANSSVDDRLATIAPNGEQIAFVGLSSGNEEIWLSDIQGEGTRKLTAFNDHRHYIDLKWSYNGKRLMASTLNEIHIIDIRSGESQVLKIPQVEMRSISFKNDRVIAFSKKTPDGWRVHFYDIDKQLLTLVDKPWQFVHFSEVPEDTIWVDSEGMVYSGVIPKAGGSVQSDMNSLAHGRFFNYRKLGNKWYWQQWQDGRYQLMVKESGSQASQVLLTTDSYYFDVSKNGIAFHTTGSRNIDIYQSLSH